MAKVKELIIIQKAAVLCDRIKLPGFQGVSLFYIIKFLIEGLQKNPVTTRASALSFHFFIALFPTIIFIFTVIPYIPIDNFQEQLLLQLENLLPKDAYQLTRTTIEDIIVPTYMKRKEIWFGLQDDFVKDIELKGYMEIGDWKNSSEQRDLMVNYKIV